MRRFEMLDVHNCCYGKGQKPKEDTIFEPMMQKTARMGINRMTLLLCRHQVRNVEAEVQKKPAGRRDVIGQIMIRAAIVGKR